MSFGVEFKRVVEILWFCKWIFFCSKIFYRAAHFRGHGEHLESIATVLEEKREMFDIFDAIIKRMNMGTR